MKGHVAQLNPKYMPYIPIFGVFLVICLFLPYIFIQNEGISKSGINLVMDTLHLMRSEGANSKVYLVISLLVVPAVLSLVFSLSTIFIKRKQIVHLSCIAFVICVISAIVLLLISKKTLDASEILSVKFLIKYLSIGYWMFMIVSLLGLITSMKAAKINPGYIVLTSMSALWLLPLAWVLMISFRAEIGSFTSYFWPKEFTLDNYKVLLTDTSQFYFAKWYANTLLVATCSCIITTIIVLSTAYTLSRIRFKGRRAFMNLALVLGMFPPFMSMIAVYYILKGLGFTQSLVALILVYSGGAALGYYIVKGFFDTIPKALDEAAYIDGANKWHVFTRITIPLSKPVIIFTILISFISPWGDFIFARVIMGDNYDNYTVALGLFTMLDRANIAAWYTKFAAGAVLISIPIAILFICFQKYYVEGLSGSVKG